MKMEITVIVQNYPNPFIDQTFIDVNISVRSNIQIEVYDILGQRKAVLANGDYSSGVYQFNYKPEDTGSGIYMYRITVKTENNKKVFTGKLVKQ